MTDTAARPASLGFILATLCLDGLGFGLVVPVIPSLVVHLSGRTLAEASVWVGSLLAAFSAMQFLCAPLLGALSDRYGRRAVLLISLAGISVNYLLLAWAPTLPWLFAGRLVAGATASNASVAGAFIADITPPERRAQRFGLIGATFGVGFVLGPALGGLLGSWGLRLPFVVSAVLAGLNFLFGLLLVPESLPASRRAPFRWRNANPFATLRVMGAGTGLDRLALAWCAGWLAIGALQSSFVLANEVRFGWTAQENGLALGAMGLGMAVVQGLLVRRLVPRLGEWRAALAGYVLAGLAYLLFGVATAGWVVFVAIALQALGAIGNPAVQAMVSARTAPDRQGQVQGALTSLQGLTAVGSPLLGGWLFGLFAGPAAPVSLPGAPFLVAMLAYAVAFWAVLGISRPLPAARE